MPIKDFIGTITLLIIGLMLLIWCEIIRVKPTLASTTVTYNCDCECKPKAQEMRITGYIPTGQKTALMEDVVVGYTAAVSPDCIHLLGSKVYIKGYGIRRINDLTSQWVADKFEECTLDLSVPNKQTAIKIGNNTATVIIYD